MPQSLNFIKRLDGERFVPTDLEPDDLITVRFANGWQEDFCSPACQWDWAQDGEHRITEYALVEKANAPTA